MQVTVHLHAACPVLDLCSTQLLVVLCCCQQAVFFADAMYCGVQTAATISQPTWAPALRLERPA
jgi:hypothetical protein